MKKAEYFTIKSVLLNEDRQLNTEVLLVIGQECLFHIH